MNELQAALDKIETELITRLAELKKSGDVSEHAEEVLTGVVEMIGLALEADDSIPPSGEPVEREWQAYHERVQ